MLVPYLAPLSIAIFMSGLGFADRFDPDRDLEGFTELEREAPPRFEDEFRGYRFMEGDDLDARDLQDTKREWDALARRIRGVLEAAKDDPLKAMALEWEREGRRDLGRKRFFPWRIDDRRGPLVLFVHKTKGTSDRHVRPLASRARTEIETVRGRLEELLGTLPLNDWNVPLWVTTADGPYYSMLRQNEGRRGLLRRVRYGIRDQALFGTLSRNRRLEASGLDDLKGAGVLGMIDHVAKEGLQSIPDYWAIEGLAQVLAGGEIGSRTLSRYRKERLERFTEGIKDFGVDSRSFFQGYPRALDQTAALDENEVEWKRAAAHGVVMYLLEGDRGKHKEAFLRSLPGAFEGRPTVGSFAASRSGLLEEAQKFARRVLSVRPVEVGLDEPVDTVTQSEPEEFEPPMERPTDVSRPEREDRPSRVRELSKHVPYLAIFTKNRFAYAAQFAEENGLDEEVARCEKLLGFLERLGNKIKERPQKLSVVVGGKKRRVRVVGLTGDLLMIEGDDGEVEHIPMEGIAPVALGKVVKKLGLDGVDDHASLGYMLAAVLKTNEARERAGLAGAQGADISRAIDDWAPFMEEARVCQEIDKLLSVRHERVLASTKKLFKREGDASILSARRDEIARHLKWVLESITPRGEAFLNRDFPNLQWDASSNRATLTYSFDDPREIKDFHVGVVDGLIASALELRDAKPISFYVKEGSLIAEARHGSFARHRIPLAPPMTVSLRRCSYSSEAEGIGSIEAAPDIVIGLFDDGQGSFVAADRTRRLGVVEVGEIAHESEAKEGYVEKARLNEFLHLQLSCLSPTLSLEVEGNEVITLDIGEGLHGRLFLYASGVFETRIDDLKIEGVLEPLLIEELRQSFIEEQIEKCLGES